MQAVHILLLAYYFCSLVILWSDSIMKYLYFVSVKTSLLELVKGCRVYIFHYTGRKTILSDHRCTIGLRLVLDLFKALLNQFLGRVYIDKPGNWDYSMWRASLNLSRGDNTFMRAHRCWNKVESLDTLIPQGSRIAAIPCPLITATLLLCAQTD